ncbi:MAG: hypothetical protein RI907_1422 [Pseudomonadota bacterium]|jgi:hypothetical protein
MIHDHIIVGSGLSALGAAMAISPQASLLVLAGEPQGQFTYYDASGAVPCSFGGAGGLGNAWHGVIPMNLGGRLAVADTAAYAAFLEQFYPGAPRTQLGSDQLFVPWHPIRPLDHWGPMRQARGERLTWVEASALHIAREGDLMAVRASNGSSLRCRRLWLAAGATRTPFLLERSFGQGIARPFISDHALCYVGLVQDRRAPRVSQQRQGVFFEAFYNAARDTLYTRRPARFAYRKLDFGIEQRAVFGMPTGTAVAKIAKRLSPGLLAEAFFNKFGVFAQANTYSIYAQRVVEDAYQFSDTAQPLKACLANIQAETQAAREQAPFAGLTPSKRNDLYIPGIHLHNSIQPGALASLGINQPGASIHVVDPSVVRNIGPEHHSFKVMHSAHTTVQAEGRLNPITN